MNTVISCSVFERQYESRRNNLAAASLPYRETLATSGCYAYFMYVLWPDEKERKRKSEQAFQKDMEKKILFDKKKNKTKRKGKSHFTKLKDSSGNDVDDGVSSKVKKDKTALDSVKKSAKSDGSDPDDETNAPVTTPADLQQAMHAIIPQEKQSVSKGRNISSKINLEQSVLFQDTSSENMSSAKKRWNLVSESMSSAKKRWNLVLMPLINRNSPGKEFMVPFIEDDDTDSVQNIAALENYSKKVIFCEGDDRATTPVNATKFLILKDDILNQFRELVLYDIDCAKYLSGQCRAVKRYHVISDKIDDDDAVTTTTTTSPSNTSEKENDITGKLTRCVLTEDEVSRSDHLGYLQQVRLMSRRKVKREERQAWESMNRKCDLEEVLFKALT